MGTLGCTHACAQNYQNHKFCGHCCHDAETHQMNGRHHPNQEWQWTFHHGNQEPPPEIRQEQQQPIHWQSEEWQHLAVEKLPAAT